jgi:hypothetical protein
MQLRRNETVLLEMVDRRFYQYLESLGFVRDNRQKPRIICFRRETGTSMQIVALVWSKRGRPGFSVHFTEAPLEGIDYRGTHLAAGDIFPGNFALLRGWLVPQRGQRWFRSKEPRWRRLFSGQPDDPTPVVERLLELFPEVISWWDDKNQREHLLILSPVPTPPVPTHAPVSGRAVKPSALQIVFARMPVWTFGFFGLAIVIALACAAQGPDLAQMLTLVIVGAMGGFMVSFVLYKILWHIRIWINGGPFRKDDLVQVLAGVHAGKIAAVYEEWPSRGQVRIDLGGSEWKDVKDVFSYIQLCRVKPSKTNGPMDTSQSNIPPL